jgi:hypothetical protein
MIKKVPKGLNYYSPPSGELGDIHKFISYRGKYFWLSFVHTMPSPRKRGGKKGTEVLKQLVRPADARRGVVRARRLFWQLAVRGRGYSGAEVARYLGVTTSAVNRLAVSEALPDLKQYLKLS